ncbi:hypothetical protein HXX76_009070 [Chlamydomonas incerta]|uniref:Uncharacterized protein n=1 Tax=Chlamydomonas incerta TaxID=51695 RepID=A0A835VWP7_CHLIN|nr:hypothetical protein HXX76_009070 [Chlamydomonas incerta]|eukprot:KAG2432147.1 hypothetical protein HXX76_009070 [Chlamydomonas incerta]
MQSATSKCSSTWHQLCCPELLERIASFLPHNEVVLALRPVDKPTAAALSLARHKIVKASEPLPVRAYAGLGRVPFEQLAVASSAEQRRHVVRLAACTAGSLEAVEAALKAMDLQLGAWMFTAAAELPNDGAAVQLLSLLAATAAGKPCLPLSDETLSAAATAGNFKACKWLLEQKKRRCSWSQAAACAAARAGHASLATWLTERSPERMMFVCELLADAAHGCNVNELTMIYTVYWRSLAGPRVVDPEADEPAAAFCPDNTLAVRRDGFKCVFSYYFFEQALAAAAGSPNPDWLRKLDTLLSLHCGGEELGRQVLSRCGSTLSLVFGAAAASAPDGLSRVRLLWVERGWRPADGLKAALEAVAARGDARGLQYLVQDLGARVGEGPQRYESCFDILLSAVVGGQLEMLRTLRRDHDVRCVVLARYRKLLQDAGRWGHVDVARWLVEEAAADVEVPDGAVQEHAAQLGGALPPPGVLGDQGGGDDRAGRVAALMSNTVLELAAGASLGGRPEVVAYGLGLGQWALGDQWKSWLWMRAARAASLTGLRLLAGAGIPQAWNYRAVYSSAADDRPTLRMLARLRCGAPDAHLALIALLEDPTVPLGELRWLLEGGGSSSSGAPGGVKTRQAVRLASRGPAAEALLSQESEWQRALEAVRRRDESGGGGGDVEELRAWMEGWRQSQEPGRGQSGVKRGS